MFFFFSRQILLSFVCFEKILLLKPHKIIISISMTWGFHPTPTVCHFVKLNQKLEVCLISLAIFASYMLTRQEGNKLFFFLPFFFFFFQTHKKQLVTWSKRRLWLQHRPSLPAMFFKKWSHGDRCHILSTGAHTLHVDSPPFSLLSTLTDLIVFARKNKKK